MNVRFPASAPAPTARWWHAVTAVASFELVFALFLYSNPLKLIAGLTFPIDESLVCGAVAAAVAVAVVARQGVPLRGLPLLAAFLLFLGWVTFSLGWSPSRAVARDYLLRYWSFDLFALAGAALVIAPDRRRMERFLLVCAVLSLGLALAGNGIYLQHGSFKAYTADWGGRVYNRVGYGVAFGTVVWLGIAAYARLLSGRQVFAALAALACLFFLAVGGSRGALLSAVTGGGTMLLLTGIGLERRRITLSVAQIAAVMLALSGGLLIVAAYSQNMRLETVDRLFSLYNQLESDAVILEANRFDYWKGAVRAIVEAPVFGHGIAGFNVFMRGEDLGAHPHNAVLEILTNFGIVGMLLFLAVLAAGPGRLQLRRPDGRADPLAIATGALFLSTVFASLVSTTLAAQYFFFAALGLTVLPPEPAAAAEPLAAVRARSPRVGPAGAATSPVTRPVS